MIGVDLLILKENPKKVIKTTTILLKNHYQNPNLQNSANSIMSFPKYLKHNPYKRSLQFINKSLKNINRRKNKRSIINNQEPIIIKLYKIIHGKRNRRKLIIKNQMEV